MNAISILIAIVAIIILFNARNIVDLYNGKIKINQTLND